MNVVDRQERLTHKVVMRPQTSMVEIERMCTWCHEHFGKRFTFSDRGTFGPDGTWQCLLLRKYDFPKEIVYEFSFDNEKDAVLFALRWA
jgi:hypothetical protein